MNRCRLFCCLTTVIILAAAAAHAGEPPNRTGFFIGFGLGAGNASWDWAAISGDESEGSGVGNFRLGGAVREDLVLGLETWAWAKNWDILLDGTEIAELQITFAATTFAATYFPGNKGAFIRGGIGFASAKTELKSDLGSGASVTFDPGTDTGVALLAATGYEWRLTRKFALAPQVQLVYLGISGDVIDGVLGIDGTLQFNWYW